jgi:hypothetical protein
MRNLSKKTEANRRERVISQPRLDVESHMPRYTAEEEIDSSNSTLSSAVPVV